MSSHTINTSTERSNSEDLSVVQKKNKPNQSSFTKTITSKLHNLRNNSSAVENLVVTFKKVTSQIAHVNINQLHDYQKTGRVWRNLFNWTTTIRMVFTLNVHPHFKNKIHNTFRLKKMHKATWNGFCAHRRSLNIMKKITVFSFQLQFSSVFHNSTAIYDRSSIKVICKIVVPPETKQLTSSLTLLTEAVTSCPSG